MTRRKRKQEAAASGVVAGLPVIQRQDDVREPVYEADSEGRPVVHRRVDTASVRSARRTFICRRRGIRSSRARASTASCTPCSIANGR
jgi:hypothetical protein